MTIKKQFFFLATIIITIPLLCVIYIFIHNYIRSSEQIIIKDYNELKSNSSNMFTKEEWNAIKNNLLNKPSEIEEIFITEDGLVLLSSINEIKQNSQLSNEYLIEFINQTSNIYYYQISSLFLETKKCSLITRIPRDKKLHDKKLPIIPSLLVFLVFIVFLCVIILIKIFKNISKSIINIEKETQEIANGDLNISIDNEKISKQQTNEISSILKSIEKMRNSLIEAQNQKNKFIMGISHDLRTPVSIIKGYTEALSDKVIANKKEIDETYNLILSKTNQLESMIDTLINYMKMNNYEIREQLKLNDISLFLKSFSKEAKICASIYKRKIKINYNLPEHIQVPFNENLITRAFENLLSNSLRYTKEKDLIIISTYYDKDFIYFEIYDSGCGIEQKELPNIFDIFYRGTNSRREEGMGIGLSVVKNIIDTHGWTILVESKKDIETKFTIKIPYSPKID